MSSQIRSHVSYLDFFVSFKNSSIVNFLDLNTITWGDSYVNLYKASHVLNELARHPSAEPLVKELEQLIYEDGGDVLLGF